MDDLSPTLERVSLWLRKLDCALFGHDYEIWQHFSPHARRVICENCGGDWGMNDDVRAFIPWDAELEGMYRLLGKTVRQRPTVPHSNNASL